MQAKKHLLGICRTFIDKVTAQTFLPGQVVNVVRLEWMLQQSVKTGIRGA